MHKEFPRITKVLTKLFFLPKESSNEVIFNRIKILAINEFYILICIGLLNRIIHTSLVFDLINFITLLLFLLNALACVMYYKNSKEILTFIAAGLISVNLLTQAFVLNIDRSRSFYVLGWVDKGLIKYHEGKLDLQKVNSPEKLNSAAIELRLREQQTRGLVEINMPKVKLTKQGKILVRFAQITAFILDLQNWRNNSK